MAQKARPIARVLAYAYDGRASPVDECGHWETEREERKQIGQHCLFAPLGITMARFEPRAVEPDANGCNDENDD